MDGELEVEVVVGDVAQQEQKVESRKQRHWQIDVLSDCFADIVATIVGVGGGEDLKCWGVKYKM